MDYFVKDFGPTKDWECSDGKYKNEIQRFSSQRKSVE